MKASMGCLRGLHGTVSTHKTRALALRALPLARALLGGEEPWLA
jgi:hypothetical protein